MRNRGFGFNTVLVSIAVGLTESAGCRAGKALVSQRPMAGVAADAEDFGSGAHLAIGRVVEGVAFEAARGFQAKAGGLQPIGESGEIAHAEFDLGFDGHGSR